MRFSGFHDLLNFGNLRKVYLDSIIEDTNGVFLWTQQVSPYSNFQKDLDMDSLDTIEVVMAVEEEFGIEIPYGDADKILTIQDAIDYITSQPQAK